LDIEINHSLLPGLRVSQLGTGDAIRAEGDIVVADTISGGDLTYKNTISGVPQIAFVAMGTGTNGATLTRQIIDDSPAGEWAQTGGGTHVVLSADTTHFRIGANSLKIAFSALAIDGDGAIGAVANEDWETSESIGFWIMASEPLGAGDLDLLIDDTDVDTQFDMCAVPTALQWTWCEVDITSLAAGSGNVVDNVRVILQDAAGYAAFDVYLDGAWKWDSADEEALGLSIAENGVLGVVSVVTNAGQPNTQLVLTAQTNYFVNYESGVDFVVWITDQSASSATALVAYR
jgi:hypothetical protein